jgi:hypothetical protein
LRSRAHALFYLYLSRFIQHTTQLLRSPRSNPIVSFCATGKFLLCFAAAVLLFFIAGLLYLLCFEHVDNLGAYSIPFGDRLLISSGYVSYEPEPICLDRAPFGTYALGEAA